MINKYLFNQFGVVKNRSQNDKTYCNANSNMPLNNMKFLKFGNSEIWGYFTKIKINNKKIMSRHKKSLFLALFCKLYVQGCIDTGIVGVLL